MEQRTFDAMKPAEHLEASRVALAEGRYDEGLRQASAINARMPEGAEARKVQEDLTAAKEAVRQKPSEEQRAAKLAEEGRRTAVRDLQENLKNLGYDLAITQSDKPDEIVITSKDFDGTDHRVRFLSFLRGRNGPASGVCLAGFQTVRLKGASLFFGFSESYSLECFNWR